MIIGLNIETRQLTFMDIVNCLRNSKFKFFLTGSRYFGGTDEFSDWDFFTNHDKEIEEFLFHLGFSDLECNKEDVIWDNHYEGLENITILQLVSSDKGTVQIQLLKGKSASDIKWRVQTKLKSLGKTFTNLSKPERKHIWSQMLSLAWL